MAEKETKAEKAEPKVLSPREAAWEAHLAAYAKKNPEKFAVKKARGQFDRISPDFRPDLA